MSVARTVNKRSPLDGLYRAMTRALRQEIRVMTPTSADEPVPPVIVERTKATCPRCGFFVYVANMREAEDWYDFHLQGKVHKDRINRLHVR